MSSPEIIRKDLNDLLKELEGKVPFYTPEWNYGDRDDCGAVLSKIFAHMYETIITRLNYVPRRHFLGFLETIGASLLPPQQARVPLKFIPSTGATGSIIVPVLTQAAGTGGDGKPAIFETEGNTVVTASKMTAVYSIIKAADFIHDHSAVVDGSGSSDFFMGDNLQEHILYIGDKKLLDVKHAQLVLFLEGVDAKLLSRLADEKFAAWEYGTEVSKKENGKDVKALEWRSFETVSTGKEEPGLLLFGKENDDPISETELAGLPGIKSRWMRCRVKGSKIAGLADIGIKGLKMSLSPGTGRTISVRMVQGIGDIFQRKLVEKGIDTVEKLLKLSPDGLSATLLNCSPTRAVNILEAARKVFLDKTGSPEISQVKGIMPDLAFCNDIPVNLSQGFFPFGNKPQLYSALYIASGDAFSKKGYDVSITVSLSAGKPSSSASTPRLSWEYWDGEGWVALDDITENWSTAKSGAVRIGIAAPRTFEERTTSIADLPAIEKTRVNGKESYWIRVRLVDGDYGKDVEITANGSVGPGIFHPPEIRTIRIDYTKKEGDSPEFVAAKNNLASGLIAESPFNPFAALSDEDPTLYFGFDKPLIGGPVGLFVDMDERFEYPRDFRPRVAWQYFSEDGWREADVLDGTASFTRRGIVQISLPSGTSALSLFGMDCHWIRAVFSGTGEFFDLTAMDMEQGGILQKYAELLGRYRKNLVKGMGLAIRERGSAVGATGSSTPKNTGMSECAEGFELYNLSLLKDLPKKLPPHVLGLYPNTVWSVQSKTIRDEIAGSSNGQADQVLTLLSPPVIDASLWVDEAAALSEGEMEALRKSGSSLKETKDEKGNITAFRVGWDPVEDFTASGPKDRHYLIDKTVGGIIFGDGLHGMIPPKGKDNITVTYSSGGGTAGNIAAREISKLLSPVSSIDKVFNPVASEGGNDTEDVDSLTGRAPAVLKNRHRAVALDDFERLAKEASRDVSKVMVIPNFNEDGMYQTGWVTVVIVPDGKDAGPSPSPALRRKVEDYLKAFSPNIAVVRVIQPSYIRVDIQSELVAGRIDAIPVIEQAAVKRLSDFLHPLTGGSEGKGWEFGSVPCISDIYGVLGDIQDVDHVKKTVVTMFTAEGAKIGEISDNSDIMRFPAYALICSGAHKVIARLGG